MACVVVGLYSPRPPFTYFPTASLHVLGCGLALPHVAIWSNIHLVLTPVRRVIIEAIVSMEFDKKGQHHEMMTHGSLSYHPPQFSSISVSTPGK